MLGCFRTLQIVSRKNLSVPLSIYNWIGRQLNVMDFINIVYIWLELAQHTCTLDSGKLILRATSSLIKTSGYWVSEKSSSRISSCVFVKVVLSRLCFLGIPKSRQKYIWCEWRFIFLKAVYKDLSIFQIMINQ